MSISGPHGIQGLQRPSCSQSEAGSWPRWPIRGQECVTEAVQVSRKWDLVCNLKFQSGLRPSLIQFTVPAPTEPWASQLSLLGPEQLDTFYKDSSEFGLINHLRPFPDLIFLKRYWPFIVFVLLTCMETHMALQKFTTTKVMMVSHCSLVKAAMMKVTYLSPLQWWDKIFQIS